MNLIEKLSIISLSITLLLFPLIGKSNQIKHNPLPQIELEVAQVFPINAARSVDFFRLNNSLYLAMTQFAINTASAYSGLDGGDSDISSFIYQWKNNKFVRFQTLPSHGGRDMEFFRIGQDKFIALANLRKGKGPYIVDADSTIWKWNGTKFELFQEIPTHAAQQWSQFSIDNQHFLAVANYAVKTKNGPKFTVNSEIYRFDGVQFKPFQSIPTYAAFALNHFKQGTNHFLSVANSKGSSSEIYIWKNNHFLPFQKIATKAARDIKWLSIANKYYLAIANFQGDAAILQWNGKQYAPYQRLQGKGARRFVPFTIDGYQALVQMNYLIKNDPVVISKIYLWDGKQFVLNKEFQSYGGTDAAYTTIAGKDYLAVANAHKNKDSFRVDSYLYSVTLQQPKE